MLDSQATATLSPNKTLNRRARAQLTMLLAGFLLGMGVNLIGVPSEAAGAAKAVTSVLLVLHAGLALGLLVGAVLTIRRVAALVPKVRSQAWLGAALVAITVAVGVITMITNSSWWSYLMAVGFIALLVVYGRLYAQTRSA
jgi:hypothetical protein